MSSNRNVAFPLLGTLVVGGMLLWGGGCDASHVDEGSKVPVAEIVADLSAASTPAEAQTAMVSLFRKTGVGLAPASEYETDDLYGGCDLTDSEVLALANAQVEYKQGVSEVAASVRQLYEDNDEYAVAAGIPMEVLLTRFTQEANAALRNPETADNALLISVAAEGGTIPSQFAALSPERVLTPAQEFLFAVWLFGQYERAGAYRNGGVQDHQEEHRRCIARCVVARRMCFGDCRREYRGEREAREWQECRMDCRSEFRDCVADCDEHDQGGGGDDDDN